MRDVAAGVFFFSDGLAFDTTSTVIEKLHLYPAKENVRLEKQLKTQV
jgi:hypothetical protein